MEWVRCSERLPEDFVRVWATRVYLDGYRSATAADDYLYRFKGEWLGPDGVAVREQVIAWMNPVLKPYDGEA